MKDCLTIEEKFKKLGEMVRSSGYTMEEISEAFSPKRKEKEKMKDSLLIFQGTRYIVDITDWTEDLIPFKTKGTFNGKVKYVAGGVVGATAEESHKMLLDGMLGEKRKDEELDVEKHLQKLENIIREQLGNCVHVDVFRTLEEDMKEYHERLEKIEKELTVCYSTDIEKRLDNLEATIDGNCIPKYNTTHIPATVYMKGQRFEEAGSDDIFQLVYGHNRFFLLNTVTSNVKITEFYKTCDSDVISIIAFEETFGMEYDPID